MRPDFVEPIDVGQISPSSATVVKNKEECNGNHHFSHRRTGADRGDSRLAAQPQLGLRPKRRTRAGFNHSARAAVDGAVMTRSTAGIGLP